MLSHVHFIITYIHEYLRVQRQGFADLSIKSIILYGHLHIKKSFETTDRNKTLLKIKELLVYKTPIIFFSYTCTVRYSVLHNICSNYNHLTICNSYRILKLTKNIVKRRISEIN